MKQNTTRTDHQKTGAPAPKKPYDPPRVVSHNALEVIASACTPAPPGKRVAAQDECTISGS